MQFAKTLSTDGRASVAGPRRRWPASPFFDTRILVLAISVGLVIAACGVGVDRVVHHTDRLYASDLYTAIVACVLSYLVMVYEQRRRTVLERRMMIAAEVNHHIRNALTAVVFSASVRNDPTLQSTLDDATARIDWVLTTVLPDGAQDLKWPVQAPEWRARSWRQKAKTQPMAD